MTRSCARCSVLNEIARNISARQAAHPDDAEQYVRKILANPGLEREGIFNRGMHMRGAFDVAEFLVDHGGSCLDESADASIAGFFRGAGNFRERGEMRDVARWREKIEVLLLPLDAARIEVAERHRAGFAGRRIVREHDGFGFDAEVAMFGQDVELMHPVAVGVAISGATRVGSGVEAKREAA